MAMEEVTRNMTIAVIMVHLVCNEVKYLWRKTKSVQSIMYKLRRPKKSDVCRGPHF